MIDIEVMQRAVWTLATVGEVAVTKRTEEQATQYQQAMKFVKANAAAYVEYIGKSSWEIIRGEYGFWKEGAFADMGLLSDRRVQLPVFTSNLLDSEIDAFLASCYAADGVLYEAYEQAYTSLHRWRELEDRAQKLFKAAVNLATEHHADAVFEVYLPEDIRPKIIELEVFVEALKLRLKRWEVARETISRLITHRQGVTRDPIIRTQLYEEPKELIGSEEVSKGVGARYGKRT